MSRILVIGRDGMLARALRHGLSRRGHAVRAVGRAEHDARTGAAGLDLGDAEAVVNAAGLINRRIAGPQAAEEALLVNALFPRLLADRCQAAAIPFIHMSTDCVFSGMSGPRTESEIPDARDLYGRSKALGEPVNALVLRTSIVGPQTSPGDSLLCWFLAQRECRGYRHHLWNGVTTLELVRVIAELIESGRTGLGVRHVFGADMSKHEVLLAFRDAFGHDIPIEPTADGPLRDMRLATEHPEFLAALKIRPFVEQLAELAPVMDERGAWKPDA